jgi:hypothetical protein
MGFVIVGAVIIAVVVVIGGTGMWVWSQFSLIKSNRSLAKSYDHRAKQFKNR